MKNSTNEIKENLLFNDGEFDLISTIKIIWEDRTKVIKTTLVLTCFGLFVALASKAEYSSNTVIKPILSSSDTKLQTGLGGLAAMAGINLPETNNSAEIHPLLYPKIIESYSFQKELIESLVYVKELNDKISFEKYYSEYYKPSVIELIVKYSLGLPEIISDFININSDKSYYSEKEFKSISSQDYKMMKLLNNQLDVTINEEQGFVSLTATMPEKIQSAQLVSNAQNILQRKVIEHKLRKAQEDLGFIEERFKEKKVQFEIAQRNLAKYRDANKNVNTATALTEIERLESEYGLAFSVYSELAKQVESQKIQVKENTPVFVVLKEAVIPLKKSSHSKLVILFVWTVFGLGIGVLNIFFRKHSVELKSKWNKNKI
tara:strand:- start:18019 stop:19143 length:1125 start_codon:yes stop_codon:yes gene_type:complete